MAIDFGRAYEAECHKIRASQSHKASLLHKTAASPDLIVIPLFPFIRLVIIPKCLSIPIPYHAPL